MNLRPDVRTAAAALASAAILFALAASGEDTTADSDGSGGNSAPARTDKARSESGDSKPAKPKYTVSQQNAIEAAENYLSISPFSKKGLVEQLSSSAGDGYPRKDAVFAVEHVDVNWKAQAVKAAKNYLDISSFSCQGLIEQLSSSAGDRYTEAQAQHAAKKVGLC